LRKGIKRENSILVVKLLSVSFKRIFFKKRKKFYRSNILFLREGIKREKIPLLNYCPVCDSEVIYDLIREFRRI